MATPLRHDAPQLYRIGQPVRLTGADGAEHVVHVQRVEDRRIAVERPAALAQLGDVVVRWTSGPHVLEAEARAMPTADPARIDLVLGQPRSAERRSSRRHRPETRLTADVHAIGAPAGTVRALSGTVQDVAVGSLALCSHGLLLPGTAVEVTVRVPGQPPVLRSCPARVVRTGNLADGRHLVALELELPPLARAMAQLVEMTLDRD